MPKLLYLGGSHHLSYRTDPHTEFRPSNDDARSHADVPVSVGRVLTEDAPALYAWADGEPADEPVPAARSDYNLKPLSDEAGTAMARALDDGRPKRTRKAKGI